jgi:hypothetical protein
MVFRPPSGENLGVPEPPERQRIFGELMDLAKSRPGCNGHHTLHESGRAKYICSLDVVVRSTLEGGQPGTAASQLIESAIEGIYKREHKAGVALTALMALGEGHATSSAADRLKFAAITYAVYNYDTFRKNYLPTLIDRLADAVYTLAVSSGTVPLPTDPYRQLGIEQARVVAEERERLRRFNHGLPQMQMRAAQLTPTAPRTTPDPEIEAVLSEWAGDPDSNLLVLVAGFGNGKTTAVLDFVESRKESEAGRRAVFVRYRDVVERSEQGLSLASSVAACLFPDLAPVEGEAFLLERLDSLILILDGFDATVLAGGRYSAAPDLREVSPLIEPAAKLLIATDRTPHANDELIKQLNPSGIAGDELGLRRPRLVQMRYCSPDDIVRALHEVAESDADQLLRYLDRLLDAKVDALRRPLFLQMLVRVAVPNHDAELVRQSDRDGDPLTLIEIFDRYVAVALERDWLRGTSFIPPPLKRGALRGIALDLFRATTGSSSRPVDEARLEARLMPLITQKRHELKLPEGHTFDSYHWGEDFWTTNHLASATSEPGLGDLGSARVRFDNDAFYDYFLADAMLGHFHEGQSINIDDEHFSQSALSALVLYFMKQRTNHNVSAQLRRLAIEPGFSHIDRMLMFYLLEDDPEIGDLLRTAPEDYIAFLYRVERQYVTVLARVVKYQLILFEDDRETYDRALEFIDWVHKETEVQTEPEGEQPAFREPIEPFLLGRLANKALAPAIPVTAYRLGQFGGADSVLLLENVRESLPAEGPVAAVVTDALQKIERRLREEET